MKRLSIILLLIGFNILVHAQTNKEKALELKNQAIELMDNGEIDQSIALLEKAHQLDPDNINIPYEKAFAYHLAKDYDESIKIGKSLMKQPDVFDMVYQLVGNSYDLKGDQAKAIKTYDKGLKKFPNSGRLYLEKGIVLASQDKWGEALDSWEQGIIADPTHSSNYFYASQVLAQTDEKIWGIYYGEIFLNLEPNTKRTPIISKLVYDTYKICLPTENNKWGLQFSQKATNIAVSNLKDLKFPFETIYLLDMEKACKDIEPKFTIGNLIAINQEFLKIWYVSDADRYPNLIFDYHNQLVNSNFFEPYMYWLLKGGAENEFINWKDQNEATYDNFIQWFNENPLKFPDDRETNRFSYD